MKKKGGFTLVEMIVVLTMFFVLMSIVIWFYIKMIWWKYSIQARQTLIQNSYYIFENINLELKNFTIDYEEYFNRKMVGCDWADCWDVFKRNVDSGVQNWHCDNFTFYGNRNSISSSETNNHILYYCSSLSGYINPELILKDSSIQEWSWCFDQSKFDYNSWYQQSFGQYQQQFRDYKDDIWKLPWVRWDDDDENVGIWPISIADPENIKELYLISQDGMKRILIRRTLIEKWDWNKDWTGWDNDSEYRYNLQILKLRGFDAWSEHNFDNLNSEWIYDSKIDTWACDFAWGFICNGSGVWWPYSGFNLPADNDDGWVNLFEKNLTISDFNLIISPSKNPNYAWAEPDFQINPYIRMTITSKLYGKIRYKKLWYRPLDEFKMSLQTTFNTKNFY